MTSFKFDIKDQITGRPLIEAPAKVAVLGAARSGLAASRLLLDYGYTVYLSDSRSGAEMEKSCNHLRHPRFSYHLGKHNLDDIADSDFIIVSPGIDERSGILGEPVLKNIPIFGEVELSYWFCRWPMLAVTGTNGKSTTVTLIDRILNHAGITSQAAGNIGRPICSFIGGTDEESILVAEISSYQLHTINSFRPRVALLLNLSPDHLERYESREHYYDSKFRLFENMTSDDIIILNSDDPDVVSREKNIRSFAQIGYFGLNRTQKHLAWLENDSVFIRAGGTENEIRVIQTDQIPIPGRHNVENVLAAAATAAIIGVKPAKIAEAIRLFQGLAHRLEKVARVDEVTYVNDSKATTVDSVFRAISSFPDSRIVLIMGGRHKGAPFTPLTEAVKDHVRDIIAIGEAAPIIENDLGAYARIQKADSLESAILQAREKSSPGDTVLLSPGCSSFDMFSDFEERGNRFKQIVLKEIAGE